MFYQSLLTSFLLICISILSYTFMKWLLYLRETASHRIFISQDIKHSKTLLQTSTLTSRAWPNQRFVTAFGIDNIFTTNDHEYYTRSLKSISQSLNAWDESAQRKILACYGREILAEQKATSIPLSQENLVQILTMKIMFKIFFPRIVPPSNSDAAWLATRLNKLWTDSKSPRKMFLSNTFPFSHFASIDREREELHQRLQDLFPRLSAFEKIWPRDNPLNVLLPAYMGVWKAVYSCLTEVQQRAEWRILFKNFLERPDEERWLKMDENGVSGQGIIAETLRLYPPTRRIYRQLLGGEMQAVDIKGIHRLEEVWDNAGIFCPARWRGDGKGDKELDVLKVEEYLPFGLRDARIGSCPSRTRGGPKLVAILVGVLLRE